jgi:hypothetical protein
MDNMAEIRRALRDLEREVLAVRPPSSVSRTRCATSTTISRRLPARSSAVEPRQAPATVASRGVFNG